MIQSSGRIAPRHQRLVVATTRPSIVPTPSPKNFAPTNLECFVWMFGYEIPITFWPLNSRMFATSIKEESQCSWFEPVVRHLDDWFELQRTLAVVVVVAAVAVAVSVSGTTFVRPE